MTSSKTNKRVEKKLRQSVVDAALEMNRAGLSAGRSGNVSARFGDGMLITPSGLAYENTAPDDIVYVAADGSYDADQRLPSSEWNFHLAVYKVRPDRNALVHCHSLHATALACLERSIPAFHYMVARAGGKDIPCVPYATYGTVELANHVAKGLSNRDACLLAHHGQVALGDTLRDALELAHEVEVLASQFILALSVGTPNLLADDEMSLMVQKFKAYGKNAQNQPVKEQAIRKTKANKKL